MIKKRSSLNQRTAYAASLFVLALSTAVFTACTTTNDPTPQALVAEIVTVSVERPSATATPPPSSTPTATRSLVETAVPTSTPSPTTTPTPTAMATPFLAISAPILSSQGQLAFIKNQTLFVETAVGSGEFQEIASFVSNGEWSLSGESIVFYISERPNTFRNVNAAIWDQSTTTTMPLSNIVSNFPPELPEWGSDDFNLQDIKWSPSNNKILFTVWNSAGAGISGGWVADLNQATFSLEINSFKTNNVWWLDEQTILLNWHCGAPCEGLEAYKNGEILWTLPYPTIGRFVVSTNKQFIINYGCADGCGNLDWTIINRNIYWIDARSGESTIIWEIDENERFSVFEYPALSPNNSFFGFYLEQEDFLTTLQIIDLYGRSYGQRPNSVIMDWRPGGGPVVKETVAEEQTQLIYWPLDGSAVKVVVNPSSFVFGEGAWSGDGRFFIYSAVDEAENKSHLYLWHPKSSEPTLLHTTEGTDGFRNFTWLPDSTAVYFNLGQMELWKFEVERETLILIASSEDN